jgi:hypothetical protein
MDQSKYSSAQTKSVTSVIIKRKVIASVPLIYRQTQLHIRLEIDPAVIRDNSLREENDRVQETDPTCIVYWRITPNVRFRRMDHRFSTIYTTFAHTEVWHTSQDPLGDHGGHMRVGGQHGTVSRGGELALRDASRRHRCQLHGNHCGLMYIERWACVLLCTYKRNPDVSAKRNLCLQVTSKHIKMKILISRISSAG